MRSAGLPAPAALAAALALSLTAIPAAAQTAEASSPPAAGGDGAQTPPALVVGGSVLEQAYATYAAEGDFGYGSSTTLGLDLDVKGDRVRASASLEAAVMDGAAATSAWAQVAAGEVPTDELFVPSPAPSGGPNLLLAARVRTLYVKLDEGWAALTAGRQVINYERGALWSPTDLFTQLDLTGLSPVRLGSDALRLTVPLGATGAADFVAAPDADPGSGRYSARLSGLVLGVDGALTAARDGAEGRSYVGADFKADLEVGLYGDAIYALPDSGGQGSWRAAGGADYSFGDWIVAAEYYYNGEGASADPLFPDAHNLYGSLTWRVTEFLDLSGTLICDASGGSGTGTLLLSYSVAQGATLGVYAKAIWGEGTAAVDGELGATLEVAF